jgi:hypothetical protein
VAEEIPPGGTEVPGPRWDPWRPEEAAQRLAGVTAPWCAAARHSELAKNRAGFAATWPLLGDDAVGWLRRALARVHPGHAWIGLLGPR